MLPVANAVDAEITLHKHEPSIRLKNDDGNFTCPLTWWKLLCIPVTSAPSECVFSTAGLTIAKDLARLASDTANELIVLHDALPAIHWLNEAQGL